MHTFLFFRHETKTISFGGQVTTEEHQKTQTTIDGKKSEEEQHKTSTYIIPDSPQPPSAFKPVEFKVQAGQIQTQPTVPAVSPSVQQVPTHPPPESPKPGKASIKQIPSHRSPAPRSPAPRYSTPRYSSPSPHRLMVRYPSEPSLTSSYSQYSEQTSYSSRNVSQSPQRYTPVHMEIQMNGTAENVPQLKRPSQYTKKYIKRGKICSCLH